MRTQTQLRFFWSRELAFVFLTLLFASPNSYSAEAPTVAITPKLGVSVEETGTFFFWVLNQIDPNLRQNQHLAPATRQRMLWAVKEDLNGRLSFQLGMDMPITYPSLAPLSSNYKGHMAQIIVNMPYLEQRSWTAFKNGGAADYDTRTLLSLLLSHEVSHLKRGEEKAKTAEQDFKVRVQEEKAAWRITALEDVRPLCDSIFCGHGLGNLPPDFATANAILRSCNDDAEHCPAFDKFAENHTKKD